MLEASRREANALLPDGTHMLLYKNNSGGLFTYDNAVSVTQQGYGFQALFLDYDDDGDLDLGITGIRGDIRLLRNDGGNNHHFIKMKLVGLRAGSAKNNYFGINFFQLILYLHHTF